MKLKLFVRACAFLCAVASLVASTHAQSAAVSFYGIGKIKPYLQTSDTAVAPASDGYAFDAFAEVATAGSVFGAILTPQGSQQPIPLTQNDAGDLLSYTQTFSSQASLDSAFPAGSYSLTLITADLGSPINITLGATAYPTAIPQISGYAALQAVDPTKPLQLNWNAFAGAGLGDFEQLTILDDSGSVVYQTGLPGPTGLNATAQSFSIPANTLSASSSYTGTLTFFHLASTDTTSLAGATGVTAFANQTSFSIVTPSSNTSGGGGGGIPTGTPPVLVSANPFSGQSNVSVSSPVVFTFTVAMSPVQKITWSANVDTTSLKYTWSADGKTLTVTHTTDFPASATISWTLDPATFKDQTGVALLPFNNTGSFKTGAGSSGGGGNPGCSGGSTNSNSGFLSLFKSLTYKQTGASAPVLSSDNGATFGAMLSSPTNNPVVSATVTLPGGATKPLTNFYGSTLALFGEFATQEAMDAQFPNGVYMFTINRTSGTANISLNLGSGGYPPTPQIQNFTAAQSFDRTADFTFQWLPFTGAVANDGISFSLFSSTGEDFHAPDPCVPRDLKNTDVSILVPKNTFSGTLPLNGSLSFSKSSGFDTNTIPGIPAFAGITKDTSFDLGSGTGGGGTVTQPNLGNVTLAPDGHVTFQVTTSANALLTVEASNDLKTWTQVPGAVPFNGGFQITDPGAVGQPHRFYRASAVSLTP